MHFFAWKMHAEKNRLFFFVNGLPVKNCIFMHFQNGLLRPAGYMGLQLAVVLGCHFVCGCGLYQQSVAHVYRAVG